MPQHPVDGAEDAAIALTAAGIPNYVGHTGGNYYSCFVPVGHDVVDDARAGELPYLSINGDETVPEDDRFVAYYRTDAMADDVRVIGAVTLSELIEAVRQRRRWLA